MTRNIKTYTAECKQEAVRKLFQGFSFDADSLTTIQKSISFAIATLLMLIAKSALEEVYAYFRLNVQSYLIALLLSIVGSLGFYGMAAICKYIWVRSSRTEAKTFVFSTLSLTFALISGMNLALYVAIFFL